MAEYIQAGVVQSAEGKGSVSDHSDLALGAALWTKNPLREHLDAADTILVVGSRCAVAAFQPNQKIVQLDVDAEEIGRNHPETAGLVGDARLTLERMLERLRGDAPPKPSRKASGAAARSRGRARYARAESFDPGRRCARARRRTPSSSPA